MKALYLREIRGFRLVVVFSLLVALSFIDAAYAQENVTDLFKNPLKNADRAYLAENYALALSNYQKVLGSDAAPKNIDLRLARCYYLTHHYTEAVLSYQQFMKLGNRLAKIDQYYYAEALASKKDYSFAKEVYYEYLKDNPGRQHVAAKIWRIDNIQYLFEDSLKNAVHFANINTDYDEVQMVNFGEGVILTSNRPAVQMISRIDGNRQQPFNQLFYTTVRDDPFSIGAYFYDELIDYGDNISSKFHLGPIALYHNQQAMVYTASSTEINEEGFYPLQLFFATYDGKKWRPIKAFPFNDLSANYMEPTISEDGKTLLFVSDKAGGLGGLDIYQSNYSDGKWSAPKNLGETVNTVHDEVSPFLHADGTLYFSSNGHPGLGALDIFKVAKAGDTYQEVENMGYPLNSSDDDLFFSIDSLKQQGFLSSNREKEGLNHDIYEVDLNLQPYPLEVKGIVKFIEHNWMDSTELEILAGVSLKLIDIATNKLVATSISDEFGKFSFIVPTYSQYKIRIEGKDLDGIVSFEVPKYAKEEQSYEIVVVNDDFKRGVRE